MTSQDSIELLIKIQAQGQDVLAAMAAATTKVEAADKRATEATKQLEEALKRKNDSMGASMLKANLLAEGIMKVAGAVKTYTTEAAQYAARTEQVSSVMDNLARVNGMSINSVRMQANAIRELGITTQESRNVINLMIGSQLDLSKSLELTRMAQNAAKVAGISSSEALQRLTYAITSGQPEMLRTLGIAVNFEAAYTRAAQAMGKTSNALNEQEKLNIRLNSVLARGPLIDGSYVMSLTTAAGQMQSLQRYSDELKNALGNGLQPAMQDIIRGMESLNKFAIENADGFQKMASGVSALGVAGAVFAATAFIPNPVVRGGIAAAAGLGTYALTAQDPVQARVDMAKDAIDKLEAQRKVLAKQLELGLIDQKAFDRFAEQLPKFKELLRAQLIENIAPIFKQRQEQLAKTPKPVVGDARANGAFAFDTGDPYRILQGQATIPDAYDLGGVKVSRSDIEAVMNGAPVKFDKSGLIAHNDLMNPPAAGGQDKAAIRKAKQLQDRIDKLVESLREYALSELEKFDSQVAFQLADLKADGANGKQSGQFLTAALEKRRVLLNNALNPAQADARMQAMLYQMPTSMQLYAGLPRTLGATEVFGGTAPVNSKTPVQINVDEARNTAAIATVRERATAAMQRYVSFQEQMIRLTAGPGGEYQAVNAIAKLRIDSAETEFARSMKHVEDRAKLEAVVDQARKDRVLQIAQLQQQELEKVRQTAGSVFDAMMSKGISGIGDVIKGQLAVVGRTVFQNIAVEIFRQAKDNLKLGDMVGGQVGKDGKLTPLGRILQGTPFGVDQSKLAMDQNTTETRLNTQATRDLKLSIDNLRAAGGTGAGAGDAADAAGQIVEDKKFGGKLQKYVGSALAIGAGVYGITQGVQQGGVKGAFNAAAGVAGAAAGAISSGLLGASAAAGPLAPILAGVALAVPLITSMFGQNKQKFDQEQNATLNANRYTEATASNRTMELRGGDVDYDFTGRLRTANEKPTIIQFNVSAMDSKSFLDRSQDIADAIHKELRLGNRVGLDIQQAILGT